VPDGSEPQALHWAEKRGNHGGVDEIPLPADVPGRVWLCGKSFIAPDPEAALDYIGGTTVVCLNELSELDWYPQYVDWLKSQPSDRVLWWPIEDLSVPSPDRALELFGQLRSRLMRGQRLLIHCGAGIGRAGTIAAGLLVIMGDSPEGAVAHVRAHRPMGGPEVGPQTDLLYWLAAQRADECDD
jgi:protein-tyrosine phosphatase